MVKYTQVSRLSGSAIAAGSILNAQIGAAAAIALSKLQAGTLTQFAPTNPVGTASASLVMMGLGTTASTTHAKTAKLLVVVFGNANNNTVGDGIAISLKYGTGTAPANGAAVSGTQPFLSGSASGANYLISNLGTTNELFCIAGYVDNSANLNVATWWDLAISAQTAGTATVQNVVFVIGELSN